jgi:hypothetical protein
VLNKIKLNAKAIVRFETYPGQQYKVDWGHVGTYIDVILRCAVYIGFPKVCSALFISGEVFKANEK